jgi:hypothetical protein
MDDHEKLTHVPSKKLDQKLNIILVLVILNFLVFIGSLIYYFMFF